MHRKIVVKASLFTVFLMIFVVGALAACSGDAQPAATPTLTPAQERGKALFGGSVTKCSTCHSLEPNVRIVGPSLAGVAARAGSRVPGMSAREYLEMSVLKPDAYIVEGYPNAMPSDIAKQITGEQLNDLVEYLLTLK